MADLSAACARVDALLADLGALLQRARAADGDARQRALAAAAAAHGQLAEALMDVGMLIGALSVSAEQAPGVTLH